MTMEEQHQEAPSPDAVTDFFNTGDDGDDGTLSPLFQEANEKGELPTARQIKSIRVSRILSDAGGRLQRVPIHASELMKADGTTWELDKYRDDENAIGAQLGGGRFFIQPIGIRNRPLPCGHTVWVPGPPRYRTLEDMERALAERAGIVTPSRETPNNNAENVMTQELFKKLESRFDELARARENPSVASELSKVALSRDEASSDAVRSLRDELSKSHSNHTRTVDELNHAHREEVSRLTRSLESERDTHRKALDEAREEYIARRRAVDATLDTERNDFRRQIDAERRRADKETDELKASHREAMENLRRDRDAILTEEKRQAAARERDLESRLADMRERLVREVQDATKGVEDRIAQATTRAERRARELEKDLEETRARLGTELEEVRREKLDLEKENIELRQELADRPEAEAPPPPPVGLSTSPDKPWWIDEGKAMLGSLFETFKEAAQKRQVQQGQLPPVQQNPAPQPDAEEEEEPVVVAPAVAPAPAFAPEPTEPAVDAFAAAGETAVVNSTGTWSD